MKKLLCLLTAVSLLLSCLPVFAAEEAAEEIDGQSVVEKLYRLGIVNEELYSSYTPEGEITRAEFADIAAALMGIKAETNADVSKVFSDVTADTKYASSIFQLYAAGIMIGDDAAAFYPEKSITYDEAVKTAVVMLGLYDIANANGGYVTGYREYAARSGILTGVAGTADSALNQKSVYKLIDNLIDAPVFVIDSYVNGEPKVSQDKDTTFLSDSLNISVYEGIVTAFENTSLMDDTEDVGDNTIRVGANLFTLEYTDGTEFVGYYVKAYCNDDNDEALYVEITKKNDTLRVMSDDIEDSTDLEALHYRINNGRIKYADFSSEAVFMYNGKKLAAPQPQELVPDEGMVTLIDNDGNGKYDIVVIESYEVFVVDGILSEEEKIKVKYGMDPICLSENDNVRSKIYLDGEPAAITDLSKWNVISVKRSKNTTGMILCEVWASTQSMEGYLSESNLDAEKYSDYYIKISGDDTEYKISSSYIDRVKSGATDSSWPAYDTQTTFYLDLFGKVAAIRSISTSKNYGYMLRCFYDFEADQAYIKLFTKDAEFITFSASEKIKVDDTKVEHEDLESVMQSKTKDGTVHQLVVYTANEENEITKIQTAKDKTAENFYVTKDDEFVLNWSPGINASTGNYYGVRFYKYLAENQPYYFLEGTTLNFQIPKDLSREQDFKIVTKLSSTDVSLSGPIQVYDAGPGGLIGAIVSSPKEDNNFSLPAIVSKVRENLDDDGAPCKEIVFFDGSSVFVKPADVSYSYPTKLDNGYVVNWSSLVNYTKYTVDDVVKGDVIEYTTTEDGYMDLMRIIVKIDDMGPSRVDGDHLAKNGSIFGTVHSVSDNKRTAIVEYTDYLSTLTTRYQSLFVNGTIYKIDTETREIDYSSTADLDPGDKVLVNSFWWSAKIVIVYK